MTVKKTADLGDFCKLQ